MKVPVYQEFTVGNSGSVQVGIENVVNVKTLKMCFNEKIDKEMVKITDTIENRIQNAILAAMDSFITPKIKLAIKTIKALCGRDATSVVASSERGEHIRITCLKTYPKGTTRYMC